MMQAARFICDRIVGLNLLRRIEINGRDVFGPGLSNQ